MSLDSLSGSTASLDYPEVRPTLDLNFARTKTLDPRITFTRSSGGTYVGADGLIKIAGVNQPRFDHDPANGESLGLLIEESRYNITSYSEDFTNSYWSSPTASSGGTFTIISNSDLSPAGTLTADKCVMQSGSTSINYQYWNIKNTGYSPNGSDRWIWSFFVKSAGAPTVTIGGQHGGDRQWSFNLNTGLPVSGYGTLGDSYQYFGNGWYRLSLGWVPTLGAYGSPGVNFGCSGVTGDGNVGICIWGAQLEKGSFATSYIPTPSTTVITRSGDAGLISGTNFTNIYNSTEGTYYTRFRNYGYITGLVNGHAGSGSFFGNNQFQRNCISLNVRRDGLYYRNGQLVIFNDITDGYVGVNDAAPGWDSNPNNITNPNLFYNFIGAMKQGDYGFTQGGLNAGTANSTRAMPIISRFEISTNSNYIYDPFCGQISRITYWPKRLPNKMLQTLTQQ